MTISPIAQHHVACFIKRRRSEGKKGNGASAWPGGAATARARMWWTGSLYFLAKSGPRPILTLLGSGMEQAQSAVIDPFTVIAKGHRPKSNFHHVMHEMPPLLGGVR